MLTVDFAVIRRLLLLLLHDDVEVNMNPIFISVDGMATPWLCRKRDQRIGVLSGFWRHFCRKASVLVRFPERKDVCVVVSGQEILFCCFCFSICFLVCFRVACDCAYRPRTGSVGIPACEPGIVAATAQIVWTKYSY